MHIFTIGGTVFYALCRQTRSFFAGKTRMEVIKKTIVAIEEQNRKK